MAEKPEVLTPVEARGGTKNHIVRYVLFASVTLAVIAMIWTFMAAPSGTQDGATTSPDPVATRTPS